MTQMDPMDPRNTNTNTYDGTPAVEGWEIRVEG